MELFALAGCILVGYIIGLLQGGIKVYTGVPAPKPKEQEYNKSVGIEKFTEYYDETDGENRF